MSKWVLEQIKPETLLEAKVTKQKLSYFGPILRSQGSSQRTMKTIKMEGSRKGGRPDVRGIDSTKEATG